MKKILYFLFICFCINFAKAENNYIRYNNYQDMYDKLYYNSIEIGKVINYNNFDLVINTGYLLLGENKLNLNTQKSGNIFYSINLQYNF